MNKLLLLFAISLLLSSCGADKSETQNNIGEEQSSVVLKTKFGADDYGMRKYVMAFLYRGPNQDLDSATAAELQKQHMENIGKMADLGHLVLAGPFLDTGDLRGIYIFDVETIDEAKKLTETDPAIQEGSLRMELKQWYGSAAIMGINEVHGKLTTASNTKEESMESKKKVTGVGGIFFKCKDPQKMKDWYSENLGFKTNEYGAMFEFRSSDEPENIGYLQWSPFADKTDYFKPSKKEFMINYRVENIEDLVEEMRANGVEILDSIESFEYGKFVHILDPEGNKIELWEPVDVVFTNLYKGTTIK